jgi:hypothetical protein
MASASEMEPPRVEGERRMKKQESDEFICWSVTDELPWCGLNAIASFERRYLTLMGL